MPPREVFRAAQQAAGMYKASVGPRNGYSSVVFLRLPTRIIARPTAIRASKFLGFFQSLPHVVITFTSARGLLDSRSQRSPQCF